jgi:hypothetical protein
VAGWENGRVSGEELVQQAITHAPAVASVIAGSKVASWAGQKLLGPLFDAMGENWADHYRARNAERIAERALKRLGNEVDNGESVNPRVAAVALGQGAWCEDDLVQEYFAGVLAGSRSEGGLDDLGLTWANVIAQMDHYQLRLHYLLYSLAWKSNRDREYVNAQDNIALSKRWMFVLAHEFFQALSAGPEAEWEPFYWSALNALRSQNLLDQFALGLRETMPNAASVLGNREIPKRQLLIYQVTVRGIELYLWAHGVGPAFPGAFFAPDLELAMETDVGGCPSACLVEDLPESLEPSEGPT